MLVRPQCSFIFRVPRAPRSPSGVDESLKTTKLIYIMLAEINLSLIRAVVPVFTYFPAKWSGWLFIL